MKYGKEHWSHLLIVYNAVPHYRSDDGMLGENVVDHDSEYTPWTIMHKCK